MNWLKQQLPSNYIPEDTSKTDQKLTALEINLLLNAIKQHYGYDFTQYTDKVLQRRIIFFKETQNQSCISQLIPLVLYNTEIMHQFLQSMSITVTEFFRNPETFKIIKQKIIHSLAHKKFISLWVAGCATGEEAYSWAILLNEANLLKRTRIYATDINQQALSVAKEGIYPQGKLKQAESNYKRMGGQYNFKDYCHCHYGAFKFNQHLQKKITFAKHNLVHDGIFGEMSIISCRNVLIYFNDKLKEHCINLFTESLTEDGFLCLGESENIETFKLKNTLSTIDRKNKIYTKQNFEQWFK